MGDQAVCIMTQSASSMHIIAAEDLGVEIASFGRRFGAENLSPRTQEPDTEAARQSDQYMADQEMPL